MSSARALREGNTSRRPPSSISGGSSKAKRKLLRSGDPRTVDFPPLVSLVALLQYAAQPSPRLGLYPTTPVVRSQGFIDMLRLLRNSLNKYYRLRRYHG